jgi:small subunit ribosomal protein S17
MPENEPTTTSIAEHRNRRKVRTAIVTSDKMQKTVVVMVKSLVRHPLYGRIVKQDKKFKVHDENNDAHIGDTVEIMETRPISKEKCWRVVRIVERAK